MSDDKSALVGWHIALNSQSLPAQQPVGTKLLGLPIVLYRRACGTAVALEDQCPHRWVPLSGGRVEGDYIVCPYHGFKFDPAGQLVRPAAQMVDACPAVKAYALQERDGCIWLWVGEGAPVPQEA